MRPTSFDSPASVQTVAAYGVNPLMAYRTAVVDGQYGSRLDGEAGHIPIGDPQTLQRHGWLPQQQAFVGTLQLTNLLNAKLGGPATAIPATKPNPGVVPLTQMQQQLAMIQ